MEACLRFTVTLSLLIATVLGCAAVRPVWMEDLGLDYWNIPHLQKILAKESEIGETLEARMVQMKDQIKKRDQVLDELINGNLSLSEAKLAICDIIGEERMENALVSLGISGVTKDECIEKLVLHWVERRTHIQSQRTQQVSHQFNQRSEFVSDKTYEKKVGWNW